MSNDFKKKGAQPSPETPLDELLRDAMDEQEKRLLTKAWHALNELADTEHGSPGPSKKLEKIFGKSPQGFDATEKAEGESMATNVMELYQKVMSDPAAQAELSRAGSKAEGIGAVVRISQRLGQPVTPDEVRDFLAREPGEELTDDELEMVVGGKGNPNEEIKGDKWAWIGLPDDNLDGGDGNDTMYGGDGEDTMSGGTGNDSMDGAWGAEDDDGSSDTMSGGDGNDTMWGGAGDDSMSGDAGNDNIYGGTGDDTMSGGAGNDYMKGEEGDDTMDGGAGNDTMHGGAGSDILTGGGGADIFVFGNDDGNDVITDFNPNEDFLRFNDGDLKSIDVANVGGNTVISYGNTMITLEGVEMDKDQVLARVQN